MGTTKTTKGQKRRRKSERNAALYDEDTVEFIQAIDAYRRRYDRSFPAWSEVLTILKSLGYRKVAEQQPLPGPGAPSAATAPASEVAEPMTPVEPKEDP